MSLYVMSWLQAQTPALSESGQNQDTFHPGEAFSDADACAAAEWKVSELGTCGILGEPTFGPEHEWIHEPARIAMHRIGTHQNDGASRDHEVSHGVIFKRPPSDAPRRRIQSQGFGEYALGVTQLGQVFKRWKSAV